MSSLIITMIWSSGTPCSWRIWYAWHTSAWRETRSVEGPIFGAVDRYCTRVYSLRLEPEDPPGDGSWTRCWNQRPALPTAPLPRRSLPEPRWGPPPPPLPTVPTTSSWCLSSDARTLIASMDLTLFPCLITHANPFHYIYITITRGSLKHLHLISIIAWIYLQFVSNIQYITN